MQGRLGLEQLAYAYQEGEGGIAEALGLARHFADEGPVVVILGDNIFQRPIAPAVDAFRADPTGAQILLKEVPDPERFGVARLEDGRVAEIVEKPQDPPSRLAVTGCYFYDRCPNAMADKCKNNIPPLREVEENHQVACYLYFDP